MNRSHVVKGRISQGSLVTAKSGLIVNVTDRVWVLLPYNGKGQQAYVEWVYSSKISKPERELILEVLVHYIKTKAASTASGVVSNIKPILLSGIPALENLRVMWSGLKANNKKGLNQFFCTLSKLGYIQYECYHEFTSTHLDKSKSNILDPSRGRFSEAEFDFLAKHVNEDLRRFDWDLIQELSFYQAVSGFGKVKSRVTNKLLLSIVRRPIQIAVLKWSDLIPTGTSFRDTVISLEDEVGTFSTETLQLRVYTAKVKGTLDSRSFPERYPIHLSATLSNTLRAYKKLVCRGLELMMIQAGIKIDGSMLLRLMHNFPMFPDHNIFSAGISSLELFDELFTENSMAFHVSETSISHSLRTVRIMSDRTHECVATSNRIRHTVLTRGAQDGLSVAHLAKMTGVTVPAARHYIDLDYKTRMQIDSGFIGNEFLREVFSSAVETIVESDKSIVDSKFNAVGSSREDLLCVSCSTIMGRPLGCYGCPNFRPILEANHRLVLEEAEHKINVNRNSLASILQGRSVEKLSKQVEWLKLTISVCDEILERRRAINAK